MKIFFNHSFNICIFKNNVFNSFLKLNPMHQIKNPIMFTVYIGCLTTTGLYFQSIYGTGEANPVFILNITCWLWFTIIFANFAEAMAESRGKAQAASLRKARKEIQSKKIISPSHKKNTILINPSFMTLIIRYDSPVLKKSSRCLGLPI